MVAFLVPCATFAQATSSAQMDNATAGTDTEQVAVSAQVAATAQAVTTAQTNTASQTGSQSELYNTIMSALLSDPRTAKLPPDQLQALVASLAAKAQAQGVTAADITWQPTRPQTTVKSSTQNASSGQSACDLSLPGLCTINDFFGPAGALYAVPIFLLVIVLLVLIIRILHRNRVMHGPVVVRASTTQGLPPPPPPPPPVQRLDI